MSEFVTEKDTPTSFNLSYDDDHVPQREMVDFSVTAAGEHISICALDDRPAGSPPIIARGTVVAQSRTLNIITDPLIEWCIEYDQSPHLWVRSASVWYRLGKPAKEYVKVHDLARKRFELCSRIFILASTYSKNDCSYRNVVQLLSGPYGSMRGYSEKEILSQKDFILAQFKNISDPNITSVGFLKEFKEKKLGRRSQGKKESSMAGSSEFLGEWVPRGTLDKEGNARLIKRADKAVNQLIKDGNGWPFRQPVNPMRDGCPDYLQRISNPMDYGTIRSKIQKGLYPDALAVAKDVRQVTMNCQTYNGNDHDFTKWAVDLGKKFENLIRGGEDSEIAAMNKRSNSKKRKSMDGSSKSGRRGKMARKGSKSSIDLSPSRDSSTKDFDGEGTKSCARHTPEACDKPHIPGSKYCSDECGLIVARQRVVEMTKAGYVVAEYVQNCISRALLQSRN